MSRLRVGRPSPSLVISVIALFIAMGGTGYAAVHLGKNTVGSPQVKNGSLKTVDLSSAARKSLRGQKGATGAQGVQGLQGPKGDTGGTGATGPSDAWTKDFSGGNPAFTLPPGSYVLGGGASATSNGTDPLHCFWNATVPAEDALAFSDVPGQLDSAANGQSIAVSTPGSITVTGPSNFTSTLSCSAGGPTVVGLATVTKVGALH